MVTKTNTKQHSGKRYMVSYNSYIIGASRNVSVGEIRNSVDMRSKRDGQRMIEGVYGYFTSYETLVKYFIKSNIHILYMSENFRVYLDPKYIELRNLLMATHGFRPAGIRENNKELLSRLIGGHLINKFKTIIQNGIDNYNFANNELNKMNVVETETPATDADIDELCGAMTACIIISNANAGGKRKSKKSRRSTKSKKSRRSKKSTKSRR